jgi:hypothetical protein
MATWPLLTWFWRPDPWHVHVQRSAQQALLLAGAIAYYTLLSIVG